MPVEAAVLLIPAVLFGASLVRSTFGFGEAMVAVPLLALLVPVELAVPVAVLASVTVALVIVVQDWRKIHFAAAGRLLLPTFVGIPIGLTVLKNVSEPAIKGLLAAIIMGFSAHALLGGKYRELKHDHYAWLFGLGAGVLGGAYGMNGPPLVIYGSLRRWAPQHFRATLQGYFLPASLAGLIGYRMAGLWTPAVNRYYLLSLPGILLATLMGRSLNRRMGARRFLLCVHTCLIVIGTVLMFQAVRGATSRPARVRTQTLRHTGRRPAGTSMGIA